MLATMNQINEGTLALLTADDDSRKGNWIQVYSGNKYYPLDPRVEDVRITDIAHSLSLLCRYNGHIERFYSVAEHCWLLSYAVPKEYALQALLHDGCEAYTSDIPRPLKYTPELKKFRHIEDINTTVVFEKFGLTFPEAAIVKELDARMVSNETRALCTVMHPSFGVLEPIPKVRIRGWMPRTAERKYLERFEELYGN